MLNFTNLDGIAGSYDAATGVLKLDGIGQGLKPPIRRPSIP